MRREEDPRQRAAFEQAVAARDWPAIHAAARKLAPYRLDDVRFLNQAARAAQVLTDRGEDHLGEAIAWLTRALDLAPGDVETLHQLGTIAARRDVLDTAADYWHRAWTADPDNATVRASLLQLFRRRQAIPAWGLPVVEQELLADASDHALLELLFDAYRELPDLPPAAIRLLRERVSAEVREAAVDRLARDRFQRGQFDLAAELLSLVETPDARRKRAVAEARAALARGEAPPATDEPGPVGDLIRAARGEPVPAERLAAALPAEFAPVAAWLRGGPIPPFAADDLDVRWLTSALAHVDEANAEPAGDEPELRLWRRYLAARAADDWAPLLPLARRADPPWSALREAVLEQAARTAPLPALDRLDAEWTPTARAIARLRRAAAALETGEEPDWAHLPPNLAAPLRQRALEARVAADPARAAEPVEPTARWWWLMAWQAQAQGDREALAAAVERLDAETRLRPEVALQLAEWLPERTEPLLAASLRRHRERDELRRALARRAAMAGDVDRFRRWAAELPPSDRESIAAVESLLVQPLAELPGRDDEPAIVRLAAAAARAVDDPPAALQRLGGADHDEIRNLRAWLHWRLGQREAAVEELAAIPGEVPAARHNLGLLAEASGDLAAAVEHHERALAQTRVAPAVRYASHRHLAWLYRELGDRERELRHWQVCGSLREDELEPARARRAALLALGRADEALAASEALLARSDELQDRLDHVAILAAARGAAAATVFLDRLGEQRPAAAEAVAERRKELYHQLEKVLRERWGTQDYLGLFAAARDAELAAPSDREKAAALLHQVMALGNLAKSGDAAARLEQAYRKAGEVLALTVPERLRAQAEKLRGQVAERLAPQLLRQAEELFRHRANQYQELTRAAPADASLRFEQLADAFERVIELLDRAGELGGERYAAAAADGLAGARAMAVQARRRAEEGR